MGGEEEPGLVWVGGHGYRGTVPCVMSPALLSPWGHLCAALSHPHHPGDSHPPCAMQAWVSVAQDRAHCCATLPCHHHLSSTPVPFWGAAGQDVVPGQCLTACWRRGWQAPRRRERWPLLVTVHFLFISAKCGHEGSARVQRAQPLRGCFP